MARQSHLRQQSVSESDIDGQKKLRLRMEFNDTETPDLAEFEVFDYRDVVIVISYTIMSSG